VENGQPFRSAICPRKLITSESWELIELYRHYQQGVLPVSGGLYDQPAVYSRAMALIGAAMASTRESGSES